MRLLPILLAALLAGCAGLRGDAVAPAWRVAVDAPPPAGLAAIARPLADGDVVVVGGQDGFAHLLRLADGRELRRVAVDGPVEAGAARIGGLWLVADEAGRVHAFDGRGRERWRLEERAPVAALACAREACALVTADGRVRAFDARGRTRWIWADPKGAGLIERVLAPPRLAGDRWLVALPSGDVAALDAADGHPLWRATVADNRGVVRISGLKALVGAPARTGDGWVVPVAGGRLHWLDGHGRTVRTRPPASRADVLARGGRLWVGGEDGALYLLDAASGRTRWKLPLGEAPIAGLAPGRGCTWAVNTAGLVACVDDAGHVRLRLRLPEPVAAPPAADGRGGVLVLDRTGGLARIAPR